jgi:K+-sensing histidine kinase KdpD
MPDRTGEEQGNAVNVAWSDVVHFIRQLSHDLRNHLNAIELQSAYISELKGDELKGEIARLRGMLSRLTSALQSLSRAVNGVQPNLIHYRAADLAEDLRKKIEHDFSEQRSHVTWNIQGGDAMLNVDPQLLVEALSEVFGNAFRHIGDKGPVVLTAKVQNGQFLFVIEEPKVQLEGTTENWGCQPLQKVTANHYSLGLHRVRAIMEAHGGKMHAQYDSNTSLLTTILALPISSGSSKDV